MTNIASDACVRAPAGVDQTRPSIARVYDASLGGKDNYTADRTALAQILEVAPHWGEVSVSHRDWLHRVLWYLATTVGIDQFLDIGAGLPKRGNTHEVAQSQKPRATVVYVDHDPLCHAHHRALLENSESTHAVFGDLLVPGTLLESPHVRRYFDWDRPVALLVCGVLHHINDAAGPAGVMRAYIDRLPIGSYVALTHFCDPGSEDAQSHEMARRLEHVFTHELGSGWFRSRDQQLAYFAGLELLEPGVVELEKWWPTGPGAGQVRFPEQRLVLGGVGYKPAPIGGEVTR